MSYLYICEQGASVGVQGNRFVVKYRDGMTKSIPAETLENIEIFGNVQLSVQCIKECLSRGIDTCFYSKGGGYFGRLRAVGDVHVFRQRQQAKLYNNTEFCLQFSKKIIHAKISNQIVILRRYQRNRQSDIEQDITSMKIMRAKIDGTTSVEQLIGYEGQAAKSYFKALSVLADDAFKFDGRNRRPPKDPFNAMLSLGYAVLFNEIYGKIESKGMNPYFGFMHKDKEHHAALVSDMIEEWRAVIVDSTVMSLVNGHEIRKEHFETDDQQPGVFLTKEGMNIFLRKFENKLRKDVKYLQYSEDEMSFRRALNMQMNQLTKVIEREDTNKYMPIVIR